VARHASPYSTLKKAESIGVRLGNQVSFPRRRSSISMAKILIVVLVITESIEKDITLLFVITESIENIKSLPEILIDLIVV
jgi:hypothetical protein